VVVYQLYPEFLRAMLAPYPYLPVLHWTVKAARLIWLQERPAINKLTLQFALVPAHVARARNYRSPELVVFLVRQVKHAFHQDTGSRVETSLSQEVIALKTNHQSNCKQGNLRGKAREEW
jgi:hypothetical protein